MSSVELAEREESLALPPPRDGVLLAIALAGVSASGPLMAATVAPALAIAFWRNALGAGVTAILAALRHLPEVRVMSARSLLVAAGAGAFLALHFGTWVPSVKYTSVASATALVATQSVFSGLIAAVGGRRLPRPAWFGMALAIVGTTLIAGADFGVSLRALGGDLLALAGGLAAAAYMAAGSVARRSLSAPVYTTVCYSVCALLLLVACLVGGQPLHGYPTRSWVLIGAVTLCAQLFGHTLFNVVLRSVTPTFVGLALLLETPGAAVIAGVWLHQWPTAWALPGLALLFGGLVLVVRSQQGRPEAAPVDLD
ncbi:DMT family transporter [Jatrophihabitans telluris]|uniref:DMT family transporter n=1 Tax=Jatrophihabitans telluris TaxID=2038343 RepID=A0ABY4QVI5_9ACTN|nr:DMT family transporter [Jatrophihabitans telluris]UQX87671.1 DMT family transporter [Jatrophihabitans telluris]